jgi:hypothetical protein
MELNSVTFTPQMKKIVAIRKRAVQLSALAAVIFLCSYGAGSFTSDVSGLGLGQSCAQVGCHEGTGTFGASNLPMVKVLNSSSVDIANTGTPYTPGSTYTIEVNHPAASARMGFQCLASTFMTDSGVGTVANTIMPTLINVFNAPTKNRVYTSHTLAGATGAIAGGVATWRYIWTAPSSNVGAIKFNVAINVSNGNFGTTGDSIKIGTYILQQPTGLSTQPHLAVSAYPNPCVNSLQVDAPSANSAYTYRIVNNAGQVLQQETTFATTSINISTASLASGQYHLHVQAQDGRAYTSEFIKQ